MNLLVSACHRCCTLFFHTHGAFEHLPFARSSPRREDFCVKLKCRSVLSRRCSSKGKEYSLEREYGTIVRYGGNGNAGSETAIKVCSHLCFSTAPQATTHQMQTATMADDHPSRNGGDTTHQPSDSPPNPSATASASVSTSKIKLSLGTKKKKKKKSTVANNNNNNKSDTCTAQHFVTSTSALASEQDDAGKTIADKAEENARQRGDGEGPLVIPLVGGRDRNRPLLASAARSHDTSCVAVKQQEPQEQQSGGPGVGVKREGDEERIKTEHGGAVPDTAVKTEDGTAPPAAQQTASNPKMTQMTQTTTQPRRPPSSNRQPVAPTAIHRVAPPAIPISTPRAIW